MNASTIAPTAAPLATTDKDHEQMDLVVAGHVDHGKSTLIGRLMADTGSLPQGKLEQVRANCARNARPFEYAFLLDALKNEQAQGITIDTARCFFKTPRRHYIIHDAPGHVEFLKNMVTGAARAEAALLLIDAHEGIQENSRRHGYILSMLGLRQVAVLVNKMDLVGFDQAVFEKIRLEYTAFLERLSVRPARFIPIAAVEGINIVTRSNAIPWYDGPSVLEQVEAFGKDAGLAHRPLRLPVQDIYKFTESGDERRIIAGTIETGTVRAGDEVVFLPSGKSAVVKSLETFNAAPPNQAQAGQAVGLTLTTQLYVKPGDLVVRKDDVPARTGTRFRANLFWMGRAPMLPGKRYKLKLGAMRVPVELLEVLNVLDASELTSIRGKRQVDRHDVGECVFETARPVAFDLAAENERTARFVIVDDYEIAGCGIVLEQLVAVQPALADQVRQREIAWQKGYLTPDDRATRYRHKGKFVVLAGTPEDGTAELAKSLERQLFQDSIHTYYLSISNVFGELNKPGDVSPLEREEQLRRLGELAHIASDAGLVFITALDGADRHDIEKLRLLNAPNELFVVKVGGEGGESDAQIVLPSSPHTRESVEKIVRGLNASGVLPEYVI
jgi:bifunctional enzyme CysN/CysC